MGLSVGLAVSVVGEVLGLLLGLDVGDDEGAFQYHYCVQEQERANQRGQKD